MRVEQDTHIGLTIVVNQKLDSQISVAISQSHIHTDVCTHIVFCTVMSSLCAINTVPNQD